MPLELKGAYAAARGWHPSYISKLLKQGVIVATAAGLIDSEDADRRIAAARNPAKEHVAERHAAAREGSAMPGPGAPVLTAAGPGPLAEPAAPPGDSVNASYHKAKTVRESYEARFAKLKYEQAIGLLTPVADVKAAATNAARNFRDALRTLPDRIAPLAAAESDPVKVHALITREIETALNELSSRLARIGADGRADTL